MSDSELEHVRPCQRRWRSLPVMRIKNAELYMRKDYEEIPLYYYATGLQESGPRDDYAWFNTREILWARRLVAK